jgi:ABC-type glycerol-3-phosphate transport system permease component
MNKSTRILLDKSLRHLILIMVGIFFALPLVWMVSTSLKSNRQIFVFPPQWIPKPVIWRNYPDVFDYAPFLLYFKNTMIIEVACILGTLLSSSLVAYGFSRLNAPGKDFLFILMLSTMMLPYQVWMIPLYVLFTKIGWVNTFYPLTIPAFFGNALYIFLLRQFFLTIPKELEDAARLDGCSYFRIYWQIMLPLTKPALATVVIFTFMGVWNDFLGPLLYLQEPEKYTLAIGLQVFLTQHGADWGLLMAASTMIVLPVIVTFFFTQKQFIQGIVLTGLKG